MQEGRVAHVKDLHKECRKEWSGFSSEQKHTWLLQLMGFIPADRDVSAVDLPHERSAADASALNVPRPVEARKLRFLARTRGAMGTWNGSWLMSDEGFAAACDLLPSGQSCEGLLRGSEAMKLTRLSSLFQQWLQVKCDAQGFEKWSFCIERSTRSSDSGRVHIHAFFHTDTSRTEESTKRRNVDAGSWCFDGVRPCIKLNTGRGTACQKQLDCGHYYCQAPKIGRLIGHTNYEKMHCFAVQQKWVMQLWQQRKLSHEACRSEVIAARGHTIAYLREIDFVRQQEKKQRIMEEKARIDVALQRSFRPFRVIQPVEEWKKQYSRFARIEGRYKFLVLTGPSCMGKTQFAKSLFGPQVTLVAPCQKVTEPNLRNFDREVHKCIVFDEIKSPSISGNKAVFQANTEIVELGWSQCGEHIYQNLLHGIACIVCCNDWMVGVANGSDDADWLFQNAIVYNCSEPLWQSEDREPADS